MSDPTKAPPSARRAALGFNAPPEGLYFVEAIYPQVPVAS